MHIYMKRENIQIPRVVEVIEARLVDAGFEAYPVGGCVRDLLRGIKPYDWDVTTSAKPEEITALFPESFYENAFLTVTVKTGSEENYASAEAFHFPEHVWSDIEMHLRMEVAGLGGESVAAVFMHGTGKPPAPIEAH